MDKPPAQKPGEAVYAASLKTLPADMREAFEDACRGVGIVDEDVIHGLLLAQAKILNASLKAHTKEITAAVQAQLSALAQSVERIRQDRSDADARQSELLSSRLDEIRMRQAKLSEKESKGWQERALNYVLVFGVGLMVSPLLSAGIDAIRGFIHP
jgi:hypothetical protein